MTAQDQMRDIVEKAGECNHVEFLTEEDNGRCPKCDKSMAIPYGTMCVPAHNFPSPTDLNELFRLAEKLIDLHLLAFSYGDVITCNIIGNMGIKYLDTWADGATKDDALRNTIWQAIQEVK